MEAVVEGGALARAYRGKRVVVTGHTGFKGSWLCQWLLQLGAEVAGYSLPPATTPALFERLGLAQRVHHHIGDIRDASKVERFISDFAPDFVFHLAAQPLVRASYRMPLETFAINVMGTANLLNALRSLKKPCAALVVTTDKCYENLEAGLSYTETDRLGGHDPYSASKAAAEIVVSSYQKSFFPGNSQIALASARAGNVIGGGDWALDRMVPDAVRALAQGKAISIRNPRSTRPWQHVLEPLSGYLLLAASLGSRPQDSHLRSAFNFGPAPESTRTVGELVDLLLSHWPGAWRDDSDPKAPHEAHLLQLSSEKAAKLLNWRPVWTLEECVQHTMQWYRSEAPDPSAITRAQIDAYTRNAAQRAMSWAH